MLPLMIQKWFRTAPCYMAHCTPQCQAAASGDARLARLCQIWLPADLMTGHDVGPGLCWERRCRPSQPASTRHARAARCGPLVSSKRAVLPSDLSHPEAI